MTYEQKAKEIMASLRQECANDICTHLDGPSCGCTALITTALREAGNAKLEEAALMFESGGDEAWQCFPKEIAKNVRSLIQKD